MPPTHCVCVCVFVLQYGRNALEIVMKSIVKLDSPLVSPPSDFKGHFFKGMRFFWVFLTKSLAAPY